MDQSNHRDYYAARAAASHALAQRAASPAIAAIHAEFAIRYEALATQPAQRLDGSTARRLDGSTAGFQAAA